MKRRRCAEGFSRASRCKLLRWRNHESARKANAAIPDKLVFWSCLGWICIVSLVGPQNARCEEPAPLGIEDFQDPAKAASQQLANEDKEGEYESPPFRKRLSKHLHLPAAITKDFWNWKQGAVTPLALGLLGAAVWGFNLDEEIQEAFRDKPLGLGDADDDMLIALVGMAFVHPLLTTAFSKKGRKAEFFGQELETYLETVLLTLAVTEGFLKPVVGRERPDGGNHRAFPSGHASHSFVSATYVTRFWMRKYRDGMDGVSLAVPLCAAVVTYGMATTVGLGRIDNNKHWASDVFVGAAIGMFLGNFVYSLHFDDGGVFRDGNLTIHPLLTKQSTGLAILVSF